jgi:hypothetical protein
LTSIIKDKIICLFFYNQTRYMVVIIIDKCYYKVVEIILDLHILQAVS